MTANRPGTQSYEHWEPHDGKAALRNQITQTRADLGDTISELAARTDVKARAREAVGHARERARAALRNRTRTAATRTRSVTRSGASSAKQALNRLSRSPASVVAGAGVGMVAGLGVYALVRRRLPFSRLSLSRLGRTLPPPLARVARSAKRRARSGRRR